MLVAEMPQEFAKILKFLTTGKNSRSINDLPWCIGRTVAANGVKVFQCKSKGIDLTVTLGTGRVRAVSFHLITNGGGSTNIRFNRFNIGRWRCGGPDDGVAGEAAATALDP